MRDILHEECGVFDIFELINSHDVTDIYYSALYVMQYYDHQNKSSKEINDIQQTPGINKHEYIKYKNLNHIITNLNFFCDACFTADFPTHVSTEA